ncbi:MAG: hypothetical protein ACK416_01190 [Zestosphaera sp.]
MYKYYLESLGLFKLEQANPLLNLIRRSYNTLKNTTHKLFSIIVSLETLVSGRFLRMISSKSEREQRKFVEYVFIAHKVLLGVSLAILYFLTS